MKKSQEISILCDDVRDFNPNPASRQSEAIGIQAMPTAMEMFFFVKDFHSFTKLFRKLYALWAMILSPFKIVFEGR